VWIQTELTTFGDMRSPLRRLPPAILLFLSNLPKSVVAFPFYSLAEVIERIDLIYDDKFETDRADEADGVAREELVSSWALVSSDVRPHGRLDTVAAQFHLRVLSQDSRTSAER
jgi:hypothetical protein